MPQYVVSSTSRHSGESTRSSARHGNHRYAQPMAYSTSSRRSHSSNRGYPAYYTTADTGLSRHHSANGGHGNYYATVPTHTSHHSHRSGSSSGHHHRSGSHSRTPAAYHTTRDARHSTTRRSSSSGPYVDARNHRYPSVQVLVSSSVLEIRKLILMCYISLLIGIIVLALIALSKHPHIILVDVLEFN
jgi:hypothetical protein